MHQGSLASKLVFAGIPFGVVVVVDQLTKWVAIAQLAQQPILLIPGMLQLRISHNASLAFGLVKNPIIMTVLIVIALALLVATFKAQWGSRSLLMYAAFGLICGGALGNIIDRVRLGFVVDFIDIIVWSVFNIADIAIVVGLVLMLYETFFGHAVNEAEFEGSVIHKF